MVDRDISSSRPYKDVKAYLSKRAENEANLLASRRKEDEILLVLMRALLS